MDQWLQVNKTCPFCKQSIDAEAAAAAEGDDAHEGDAIVDLDLDGGGGGNTEVPGELRREERNGNRNGNNADRTVIDLDDSEDDLD